MLLTLVDFGITVEGNLVAGEHVLRIENLGAQPHFVDLEKIPAGTTNEELAALLGAIMTGGTPVAGGLTEEDFQPASFTPTQSIGTTTWTKASLEAGTYAAVCWFATAGIGDPHAVHGCTRYSTSPRRETNADRALPCMADTGKYDDVQTAWTLFPGRLQVVIHRTEVGRAKGGLTRTAPQTSRPPLRNSLNGAHRRR